MSRLAGANQDDCTDIEHSFGAAASVYPYRVIR
jgi:hypothetical protein